MRESTIKEYAEKNFKLMFREPAGQLKYKFIVPGSTYSNCLWDWDSWLTDIGINQIRRDNGNMYVMLKEVLRRMSCFDCGSVRAPLTGLIEREKRCNNT